MTHIQCIDCGFKFLRTFSKFNPHTDEWEWWKGCNNCAWEIRDKDEEKLHPEYYSRNELSPSKINSKDIHIQH